MPIQRALHRLWELVLWAKLNRRYRLPKFPRQAPKARGEQTAAFLVRDNIRHRRDIEEAYLAAIAAAREEILLANAYFLPGRRFRRALHDAARRGVRVIIVLQGVSNTASCTTPPRRFTASCWAPAYASSSIGAASCTPRSRSSTATGQPSVRRISIPSACCLPGKPTSWYATMKFARELRQSLQAAMRQGASELPVDSWQHLPWHSRLLRWASYHLIRILVGIAGYGRKR
jgi:cardiolipin synthase